MSGSPTPTADRATRTARWRIGRQSALTLADQLVSSASNFLLGVLVARAGGTESLGTFGVAFLVWLAVLGFNRALVAEPLTVVGSTRHRDARLPDGLAATLAVGACSSSVLLVLGGVLVAVLGDGPAVGPLLVLAACIPSLLAQDYCRSMAFRLHRPTVALYSDLLFAGVQVALSVALLAGGEDSSELFIAAWGVGATAGAVLGVVMLRAWPVTRGGLRLLREMWPRSKWFVAEFCTAFPADQGYLLLLPLLLGADRFGLYRAGTGLIGPVVVILIAGGNIGLPGSVRRLRTDGLPGLARYARLLTLAVAGVTIVYCGLITLFAGTALHLVYGSDFVDATTVTRMIAAQYVLLALSFGYGQAVKAAGQVRSLWISRMVSAVLSIVAVVLLSTQLGLVGAGAASMLSGLAYSVGVAVAYRGLRSASKSRHRRGRDTALAPDRR